jgi:hypothetical protein
MQRINRNEDMRRLREMARERGVKQIVVGLPLRLDGTRGEMAEEAESFAHRVRKQVGVPVEMVDERLTSWEAERWLEEVAGPRHEADPAGHATVSSGEKGFGASQRGCCRRGGHTEGISGTPSGAQRPRVSKQLVTGNASAGLFGLSNLC